MKQYLLSIYQPDGDANDLSLDRLPDHRLVLYSNCDPDPRPHKDDSHKVYYGIFISIGISGTWT